MRQMGAYGEYAVARPAVDDFRSCRDHSSGIGVADRTRIIGCSGNISRVTEIIAEIRSGGEGGDSVSTRYFARAERYQKWKPSRSSDRLRRKVQPFGSPSADHASGRDFPAAFHCALAVVIDAPMHVDARAHVIRNNCEFLSELRHVLIRAELADARALRTSLRTAVRAFHHETEPGLFTRNQRSEQNVLEPAIGNRSAWNAVADHRHHHTKCAIIESAGAHAQRVPVIEYISARTHLR